MSAGDGRGGLEDAREAPGDARGVPGDARGVPGDARDAVAEDSSGEGSILGHGLLAANSILATVHALLALDSFHRGEGDDRPLPVPYHFLEGAFREITHPSGELPGANDWGRRPSAEHPRPVVLVHGTGGGRTDNWLTYGPLLHNEGYRTFSLTYGNHPRLPWPFSAIGGMTSIEDVSAPQVAAFIDRVLAATGAEKVDVVCHSQGSVVAGYIAKRLRPGRIGRIVSLAPVWEGTGHDADFWALMRRLPPRIQERIEALPITSAVADLLVGSDFLTALHEGGPYADDVEYTNIATRFDEVVIPYTNGLTPGGANVTNIVLQDGCERDMSDHIAIASSPRAADLVLNALDPDHPRPVRCETVIPVHGPVDPGLAARLPFLAPRTILR